MDRTILFISVMKGAPWGGSEELWSQTAIRLSQAGRRVAASIPYWREPDAAVGRLRAAGCRVDERNPKRVVSLTLKALRKDPELWRAERVLKSSRPGLAVISCGAFAEDLWWADACQILGIPYIMIAQAAAEMWWPRGDDLVEKIRSIYAKAVQVFFVSRGNRDLVERMLGSRIPNASIIRNPFTVPYDIACPYPSTQPTFNLASVARLDPYAKGQDLLFEVLSQTKWKQRGLRVSLYGKGANGKALRSLAAFYGLENIEFRGHVARVEDVWSSHHILVLPSRLEGLPIVLVEAMLCGRPAIVTHVGGNTEVLDDNETGFVAAAPTAIHLDEAMERAWTQRCQWESMGREAARRIREAIPRDPIGVFADELMTLAARI